VESTSGTGTLFLITLPKNKPESGENILVVDDEHGIRLLHTRYIKRVLPNANVLHAADGAEALQLAREFHPQVIISDNDMPDLDGLELVRNLKADPTTSDIPIIIITGQDSDSNREALKQYGVNTILNKPVTPEQIAKVLRSTDISQTTVAA
jgi:chemosensory pili system protein ChpA (sensor histidine kinase/response regulator)